jgi:hypothetical protein
MPRQQPSKGAELLAFAAHERAERNTHIHRCKGPEEDPLRDSLVQADAALSMLRAKSGPGGHRESGRAEQVETGTSPSPR